MASRALWARDIGAEASLFQGSHLVVTHPDARARSLRLRGGTCSGGEDRGEETHKVWHVVTVACDGPMLNKRVHTEVEHPSHPLILSSAMDSSACLYVNICCAYVFYA